jgi:hypothetical protein
MSSDPFLFLQTWYEEHCDGDWEHQYGVEIGTLDNPGWRLRVDLVATELEGREQSRAITDTSETDWIQTWSDGFKFHAAASANNLAETIEAFRRFATGPAGP